MITLIGLFNVAAVVSKFMFIACLMGMGINLMEDHEALTNTTAAAWIPCLLLTGMYAVMPGSNPAGVICYLGGTMFFGRVTYQLVSGILSRYK